MRRSARYRNRRRYAGGGGELALRRTVPQNDVRRSDAASDLLGPAPQTGGVVAENRARALGVRGERGVSRQFLVSAQSEGTDARGSREPLGTAVPGVAHRRARRERIREHRKPGRS